MKLLILISLLLTSGFAIARDLSEEFENLYEHNASLTDEELKLLYDKEVVFVPGILSEVFNWGDRSALWDFSLLTSDYFSAQMNALINLGVRVTKIRSSSSSIETTISLIETTLRRIKSQKRQAIFITHSLGGLALLDHLLAGDQRPGPTAGIIFVQTPFYGSPIADIYKTNPYFIKTLIKPFLPFFNTNFETIQYLSVENRTEFMGTNESAITTLIKNIPIVTLSSTSLDNRSIFRPAIELMAFGCVNHLFGGCLTRTIYDGPYDESDGMVPFKNSLLPDVDFIKLHGVDHGEMVIKLPYTAYSKTMIPEILLKMLISKIK